MADGTQLGALGRRYRARGYRVLAPGWPGMDAGIEQLRRRPSAIARLGVTEIADWYDHLIHGLDNPPAIIGHSVGGLVAQILLDRGLGAAAVAIDPAPAGGTAPLSLRVPRTGLPAWRSPGKAIPLTPGGFHRIVTSTLSREQADMVRERYYVPAPGRTVRQVCLASFSRDAATRVDFGGGQRAPLLLIGGGADRIFPAAVTRPSLRRYRRSEAVTAYKEFPDDLITRSASRLGAGRRLRAEVGDGERHYRGMTAAVRRWRETGTWLTEPSSLSRPSSPR